MTEQLQALYPLVLVAGSWFVWRAPTTRVARRIAMKVVAATFPIVLAWLLLAEVPDGLEHVHGLYALMPLVTCAIAFVAVAVNPVSGARPATFARIVVLMAVAATFPRVGHPLMLAGLWALSAVTVWLEIRRSDAATSRVFSLYQVPSAVLVALGASFVVLGHPGWAFVPLIVGISIREAVVPVHSWFLRFVERAPMGIVVAFVGPQIGIILHLRLLSQTLTGSLSHELAIFGALTSILAAALGTVQTSARRALGYLIMSQSGLVAFGLENSSPLAHAGALMAWQVCGLSTSGFAMTLAALEARRGPLNLDQQRGNFERTPTMAVAFLLLGFASVGLPLTPGFVAEDLLVQGSVGEFPSIGLAIILATACNGITVMRSYFALFTGTSTHGGEVDLRPRERAALTLVLGMVVLSGVFPSVWFHR